MNNHFRENGMSNERSITITLGHEQLQIRDRYETASIFNDFLIALWFLVGSVFFLFPSLQEAGTWLLVIGSFQFLVRPTIRLAHRLHLRRIPESRWEF